MANGDRRGNPFGWIVLGFLLGVAATLAVLIALSGGFSSGSDDTAEPAEKPAKAAAPAPKAKPAPAPVAQAPAPAAAAPAPRSPEDAQIAEDAAASGMTSRSPRP